MTLWIQNKNNNSTFQYKYLSAYNLKIFLLHLFPDPSLPEKYLKFWHNARQKAEHVRKNIQTNI